MSFSLMPVFTGAKKEVRDHVVHHTLQGKFAIRMGEWKLIVERGSGGFSVPRTVEGEPAGQLYNLRTDRAETTNVYAENPQVVARLRAKLEAVRAAGRSRG